MAIDPSTVDMKGLNVEYATGNRWVGYFPIQNVLGDKYKNIELNLVRFNIPQMIMGSTTTSFKGYTVEIPTKIMDPDSKEITIEYIMDAKYNNYKSLFAWESGLRGNINKVYDDAEVEQITENDFIDCRIWLTDHFKNIILDLVFHNCWIKHFNDLQLDSNDTNPIVHSFTMAYSHFEMIDHDD